MQEVGCSLDTAHGAKTAIGGDAQRVWRRAFAVALTVFAAAPAVSLADADAGLRQEVEELKSQVRALKKQADAAPAATADAKTAAIVEEATADDSKLVTAKGGTLKMGGLKITLGGFVAAESVWRSRSESADINSSFTAYPFANSNSYYTSEFRESARQSRLQLLVQGPSNGVNKVEGFFAGDFLSSGTTSNQNQSNSYTFRVREFYADWVRTDYDLYVLAGQTWSLATPYKKSLTPRSENTPLTIDAQYVPGFNWLRTPQLRVVKNFGHVAAVGLSLENPQNQAKAGCAAAVNDNAAATAGFVCNVNGTGGGLLNATTTYSTDIAPDITFKAAFDPGFGHYEVYSLTRFFRGRGPAVSGGPATSDRNISTVAESIGGSVLLPLIPKVLDVQASGLIGHGNGRYGTSQLGDSVVKSATGTIAALPERQLLVGLVAHPTDRIDLYTYGGMERVGSAYGYGVGSDYTGCSTIGGTCPGNIQSVRQVTGGGWWKFYKGSIGYLSTGVQVSYTKLSTFTSAANGTQGKTDDATVMLSMRYYPFQ